MDLKRTIDEINALYMLEPDLVDVFVEGFVDKFFLEWYLRRKGLYNVTVYPINVIAVPGSVLAKHSLTTGSQRSRVIALSCELAEQQPAQRRVMCVVDRDSDDKCAADRTNPYLYFTDGNSIELYALTPLVMEKFFLVALGGFPLSVDVFLTQIMRVLENVYAIRLANERMSLGMSWVPFASYVTVKGLTISFRESDFIRAYLQKNAKWASRDQFAKTVDDVKRELSPNIARRTRGHDLADLLCLILRKMRKERVFGNRETVEGCLMATTESADLDEQPLFRALERIATLPLHETG